MHSAAALVERDPLAFSRAIEAHADSLIKAGIAAEEHRDRLIEGAHSAAAAYHEGQTITAQIAFNVKVRPKMEAAVKHGRAMVEAMRATGGGFFMDDPLGPLGQVTNPAAQEIAFVESMLERAEAWLALSKRREKAAPRHYADHAFIVRMVELYADIGGTLVRSKRDETDTPPFLKFVWGWLRVIDRERRQMPSKSLCYAVLKRWRCSTD